MFAADPAASYRDALRLLDAGRAAEAARVLETLNQRFGGRADVLYPLGIAWVQLTEEQAAAGRRALEQACRMDPGFVPALFSQASVFLQARLAQAAVAGFEVFVMQSPGEAEGWNRLGMAYNQANRFDLAVAAFERSVGLHPAHDAAWANLGNALFRLGKLERGLASYDRALALSPDNVETRWNRSLTLLASGRWSEGLAQFEVRWQRRNHPLFGRRDLDRVARWTGNEELARRRILLYAEQGRGDAIQFVRYALDVAARGGEVLVEVPGELRSLIARNLEGHCTVLSAGEALPELDYQCPLMSLPLALGIGTQELARAVPYLAPDPKRIEHWERFLGPKRNPRVGLVWASGISDRLRDVPLDALRGLACLELDLLGLQLELPAGDRERVEAFGNLRWLGPAIRDFDDTAAIMSLCDRIISVDTAAAHLAGALGRETLLLLQVGADWRWFTNRGDSPWYPAMRLFRQDGFGDWNACIDQVLDSMRAWSDHKRESVRVRTNSR